MTVREYVGARYVPLFADPIEWDSTKTYEPLTVVYYQGNSYTSRQAVPAGIDINNQTYWALTGNYNAQIEQYREEVNTFDSRIQALETFEESVKFTGKKFVFLGDSITWGQSELGLHKYEHPWPWTMCNILGATCINLAEPGATFTNISPNVNCEAQIAQIPNDADYIFIMLGTNDYGYGSPFLNFEDKTDNFDYFDYAVTSAINRICGNFSAAHLIGVIPPYMPGDTSRNNQSLTALDYKNAMRSLYSKKNIPIIDFTETLGFNAQNWGDWIWDKPPSGGTTMIHPNQACHDYMGAVAAVTLPTAMCDKNANVYDMIKWYPITLNDGVTGECNYWIDAQMNVHVRGQVKTTSLTTLVIGALPEFAQPAFTDYYWALKANGGDLTSYVFVDSTNGNISVPDNVNTWYFNFTIPYLERKILTGQIW